MSAPLSKAQIWSAPVALGAASAAGLVAALLADGIGDVVSWCCLSVPVTVAIWLAVRAGRPRILPKGGRQRK